MTSRLTTLALLVVVAGCGSGHDRNGGGTMNHLALQVTPPTGVAADGSATATILATATDARGNALPNDTVTLTVSGGGNIIVQPGITSSSGQATGTVASTVAERKTITATDSAGNTATANVTFTSGGTPSGIGATLAIVSGNNQTGSHGFNLDKPLLVLVTDAQGQPVAGFPVVFTVVSGGGTLSVTNATTDATGEARTVLQLGQQPGTNTVSATATDPTTGRMLTGSPLTFTETAD
jgi:adhesin/invasin